MRKLNDMYHINDELRLVKTSNGQVVPDDEPLFVVRGRDATAHLVVANYIALCSAYEVPEDRIEQLYGVLRGFIVYLAKHQELIKVPGVTHGK